MTPRFSLSLVFCGLLSLACCMAAYGQRGSYGYQSPTEGTAVDVKGARHMGREYPNHHAPWNFGDRIAAVAPIYPFADRVNRNHGSGFFRILIDPKTGVVTQVIVLKSTGYPSLDKAAVAALRRWRYKPRTWKQVEVPVNFVMGIRGKPNIPSGAIPLAQ